MNDFFALPRLFLPKLILLLVAELPFAFAIKIDFIYLNDIVLLEGENVKFNDSGITAVISSISLPDKDITDSYTVDYSRKDTILDYTRIVRKPNTKEPKILTAKIP